MTIETGYADLNGAQVYYEATGEGAPVVLVHGFTVDRRMWDDQFEPLAAEYRVIRYDVRGYGRSDVPTTAPYSNHDDLRRLLDVLDIDRAHVCGLSMGGGITFDFALEFPGRVRSISVISSALGGATNDMGSMNASMAAMAAAAQDGDLAEAKRIWLASPIFVPAHRNPVVARRLAEMVGDWSGWHLTHAAAHLDPEPPPAQRLAELTVPALVINGELDNEVMLEVAAMVEATAPDVTRLVVPDVGHMTNMEAPEAVTGAIARFLAGCA